MRILFLPEGPQIDASSRTRVYNYRPLLEQAGFRVRIIPYNCFLDAWLNVRNRRRGLIIKLANKINQFFKCLLYLSMAGHAEVVFIHRVLFPIRTFRLLRRLAKKIIFDFDDAIYLADRFSGFGWEKDKFLQRFQYILKHCDAVIVSTETLREQAQKYNSKVIVLPTSVDTEKLYPKAEVRHNSQLVLGWIGSPEAAEYLKPLKKTFELLAQRYPFLKLKLIGAGKINGWQLDLVTKQWRLEDELDDLQSIDIGIMPLKNDEWCKAKGGYKLFQYMAAALPCVATPVGINKEIIEDGKNGFLASTPQEWFDKLSLLISDAALRKRMGEAGRDLVKRKYSYQANSTRLVEMLKKENGLC